MHHVKIILILLQKNLSYQKKWVHCDDIVVDGLSIPPTNVEQLGSYSGSSFIKRI